MRMISIPKQRFEGMQRELKILRKRRLYQRLLEFEQNITQGKKYTRADLGF